MRLVCDRCGSESVAYMPFYRDGEKEVCWYLYHDENMWRDNYGFLFTNMIPAHLWKEVEWNGPFYVCFYHPCGGTVWRKGL
jgi:hypothetical protein